MEEDLSGVLGSVGKTRVVRNLSAIGVSTNIENIALDRTEWRGIVRAAETHPGLKCYGVSK